MILIKGNELYQEILFIERTSPRTRLNLKLVWIDKFMERRATADRVFNMDETGFFQIQNAKWLVAEH